MRRRLLGVGVTHAGRRGCLRHGDPSFDVTTDDVTFDGSEGATRPSKRCRADTPVNRVAYHPSGSGWPSAKPAADCTPTTARSCNSASVDAPT